MTKESDEPVTLEMLWVDLDDADVRLANQFASQFHDGMFIVSVGTLTPPLILGSDEERESKARELPFVPVRAVSRFALTEPKMEELIAMLQTSLARFRERKGG